MTKQKKETSRHWTIELNIGQLKNMAPLKHSKRIGYYHGIHNLNQVKRTVQKRFDGGSGECVKAMFQFQGQYNDKPETTFYIAFSFYGGIETFKEFDDVEGKYMAYDDRKKLEDKLLILCMELEQECIAYNIKECTPSSFSTGKQGLIYHPNYDGEQMIFEDEYFMTFGYHKLSSFDKLHDVTNTETVG